MASTPWPRPPRFTTRRRRSPRRAWRCASRSPPRCCSRRSAAGGSRADAGELPVRRALFYLDELLVECVHEVRTLALARGSTVMYDPHGEAPFTGDEALLHRLVLNLLDNAIKFSPAGGTITVRLVSDG